MNATGSAEAVRKRPFYARQRRQLSTIPKLANDNVWVCWQQSSSLKGALFYLCLN